MGAHNSGTKSTATSYYNGSEPVGDLSTDVNALHLSAPEINASDGAPELAEGTSVVWIGDASPTLTKLLMTSEGRPV